MPVNTIKGILKRDQIGSKSARRIGKALKISVDWIMSGTGPLHTAEMVSLEPITMPDAFAENVPDGFAEAAKTVATSIRERLRHVQEINALDTPVALARAAGVSQETLNQILESDSTDDEMAWTMAAALGVEFEWLRHGRGPVQRRGAEAGGYAGFSSTEAVDRVGGPLAKSYAYQVPGGRQSGFVMVRKAETHIGGGNLVFPEEGFREESYAFRLDWLHKVATSPKNVVLLDVDGDSMASLIGDGDTVMVDRGRTRIRDGKIFALVLGDVLLVKRLSILPGPRLKLESLNKEYASLEVIPEDVRIIGQVIWCGKTLV